MLVFSVNFSCSLILTFIIHVLFSLHYFLAGEEGQKSKKEWNELAKKRVGSWRKFIIRPCKRSCSAYTITVRPSHTEIIEHQHNSHSNLNLFLQESRGIDNKGPQQRRKSSDDHVRALWTNTPLNSSCEPKICNVNKIIRRREARGMKSNTRAVKNRPTMSVLVWSLFLLSLKSNPTAKLVQFYQQLFPFLWFDSQ